MRPLGEQLAVHLGLEGAALVPRAEHVPGDGTGSACEDQQRTHQSAQHVGSPVQEIDR